MFLAISVFYSFYMFVLPVSVYEFSESHFAAPFLFRITLVLISGKPPASWSATANAGIAVLLSPKF